MFIKGDANIHIRLIIIVCFFLLSSGSSFSAGEVARDFSVMINAESVEVSGKQKLKLIWNPVKNAVRYTISAKQKGELSWVKLAEQPAGSTSYIDEDYEPSNAIEYFVEAYCENLSDSTKIFKYGATGYIYAGLEVSSSIEDSSMVLILVDSLAAQSLGQELLRYRQDLAADSYGSILVEVPRAEQFDPAKVVATKKIIMEHYNQLKSRLKLITLIGRVPVAYSGNIAPDGHSDHVGAWPCDLYYGHTRENIWTDNIISSSSGAIRPANLNFPSDGKYDQSMISTAYPTTIPVGRIDLYSMPQFEKTEFELLKDYLDRNHNYRIGNTSITKRGLIDDNFPPSSFDYTEAFASSGWRNIAVLTHRDSVRSADWF